MTGSALYVGRVSHGRLGATRHGFSYGIYQHLIDLDELPVLDRTLRLFGHNRSRVVSFRDADYLDDPARPVRESLQARLAAHEIAAPIGRVLLLTHCRVLGYVFNPVSFFYCYHATTGALVAVVAEVNNTFGERHAYVLDASARIATPAEGNLWRSKKVFHVSPFMSLDGTYEFEVSEPGPRLAIRIDLLRQGARQFTSRLSLERRPFTDRELARMLVRYPMMPGQVIGAIHWEALKLWRKRLSYHPRPPYDPDAAREGVA